MTTAPLWTALVEVDRRAGDAAPNLPLLSVSASRGVVRYADLFPDRAVRAQDHAHYKVAFRGEIVLNKMSAATGAVAQATEDGLVSPDYAVLTVKSHHSPNYLAYLLRSSWFNKDVVTPMLRGIGVGEATNVRTPRVAMSDYLAARVPLPPREQQVRIADYLDREANEMGAMEADLDRLIGMLVRRRAAVEDLAIEGPHPVVSLFMATSAINTGPFGTQVKQADYVADGVPLINPSHIRAGALSPDSRVTVDEQKVAELSRHLMQPGDVVVARRGEMGRCAVVQEPDTPVLCGTGSLRVIPGPDMDPEFAALVIRSSDSRNQLTAYSVGATMDNLNEELLGRVRIPLPPLEEQRRIVSTLATASARIDAMIGDAERLKALLAERRSTLITEVVTGRKEVPA